MKSLKYLLLAASLCLVGCGESKLEPKSPVNPVVEPEIPRRSDLPMNWFEVSRNNWSYGLPMGFDTVVVTPNLEILSQHHSATRQIDVTFATHQTEMHDLHQYVLSDFILPGMVTGKQVIGSAESRKNPQQVILAVQFLYQGTNISHERMQSGAILDSSLDFFVLKEQTVYHMSCFGEAEALKKSSDVCFKAIDSLRIK